MLPDIPAVIELLLVATAVAVLARYVRLPYTVALVLGGLALSLALPQLHVSVSKNLILLVLLPPLLFEGTVNMDLAILKERGWLVSVLAIPGTALSAALIGLGVHDLFHLGWPIALLLGVMVSPTDPVSVITTFRESGVVKTLATVIEGESVFNDGIGVTLYLVVVGLASGHGVTFANGVGEFLLEVLGGAAVGAVLGYAAYSIYHRLDDPVLEVMMSIILAYGAYLAADRLNASGVIGVVVVGLIVGNFIRTRAMSPTTSLTLGSFWSVASFMANSIVFLLIGLVIRLGDLATNWRIILGTFLLMLVARSVVVYGAGAVARLAGWEFPPVWQHVANWGGLKGSIPIALAVGLPAALTHRTELVSVVIGTVAFSLVVQGLTFRPLIDRLGLTRREDLVNEYEHLLAQSMAVRAGLRELAEVRSEGFLPGDAYDEMKRRLEADDDELYRRINVLLSENEVFRRSREARTRRRVLLAQRVALNEAARRGIISQETMAAVRRDIDASLALDGDGEAAPSS